MKIIENNKEEIKFLYEHFIDDSRNFEILRNWIKPFIYPAWIVRTIIVVSLMILFLPLYDLYFLHYEEIEMIKQFAYLQYAEIMAEFESIKDEIKQKKNV